MAVGYGCDIHRLVPGRRLVLGGVEIPHPRGLLGHSDGDVVLHAVIDALLGAAGLGDIGRRFPDTDPAYKDIASEKLLGRVMDELRGAWAVENVDVTILAEEPRIAPHYGAMRARLSALLGTDRVSVKAKTMEGLGPVGAREAIECRAVAELRSRA
jgi:2-C-methyl-D-erythritol 2,4-cyclodiphosphate synthase